VSNKLPATHAHAAQANPRAGMKTYRPSDEVDFCIVGSGAAGGVLARELSRAGFSVVVLEQGPWRTNAEFVHDELHVNFRGGLCNDTKQVPQTFRASEKDKAEPRSVAQYAMMVGGSSAHFTANYWRFPVDEFRLATKYGVPRNSTVADWPITYADLEPYYTKVDWECGVSGQAGVNPFDPPRSRPYPLPPLPIKSEGVLMEKAATKLGWHAAPAPMAILSKAYRGRSACVNCGFCFGFACEVGAKSGTINAMIPDAVKTGRCEIRTGAYVRKVEVGANGRATGVKYFDEKKAEQFQRAKAVIVCANGAETPRLLLNSATNSMKDGLANSSGYVGRNLMNNYNTAGLGMFEHEINGWKGFVVSRVVHDPVFLPKVGGAWAGSGGGFDFRSSMTPMNAALNTMPGQPRWGSGWKKNLKKIMSNTLLAIGHTSQMPVWTNRFDLDPSLKDAWGVPVLRLTFKDHASDVAMLKWFGKKGKELLEAAGAQESVDFGVTQQGWPQLHLLGTARMGKDPKTSVVNADHRAHDVKNLFIVDGSSFVTSGRGQPTMTIQALAFRAADRIQALARARDL
jgi:choline dehydrogenase-like flavoprotein